MRPFVFASLLCTLPALVIPVTHAADWGLCAVPAIRKSEATDYNLFATEVHADRMLSEQREFLQFSGDVQLQRKDQSVHAEQLQYFRQPERFTAQGNVRYADDLLSLNASQLEFNNSSSRGLFEQAEFHLYETHLRGEAARIEQLDANLRLLNDVTYSTCDPQDNHWSLSAARLELDQASGMGTASHSVLRLGPVPVFYFPWFRFPITDERMSGLLPPTVSHSENHGFSLAVPFYWNQAVNYDMTITPLWYDKRGLQLNTQNRYLFDDHAGQLNLSWLDDDERQDERWYRHWRHSATLTPSLTARVLIQKVSDTDFLNDFDNFEGIEDIDYLKSSILLSTSFAGWRSGMLLEQHQTINQATAVAARPYKRLPRINLDRDFRRSDGLPYLTWKNEWVEFERDDSINGQRLHVAPLFSYPLEGDYYFIKPSLQLDFTRYQLDNNSNGSNDISRSIPLFSLDSGLFFERLAGQSGTWLQTLEPRLYLLYVPYEEQSDIPDFDSALLTESFNNLFRNNRFSGADRIGDSKQISLGITTRLLNELGSEVASFSLGQAHYLEDRLVSLNNTIDDSDRSSVVSLLSVNPDPYWQIRLGSVYNREEKESKQTDIAFRYKKNQNIFNLEYHFRENSLEQSTLSLVYPHSQHWRAYAKRQHSIRHDRPVQNLVGLSYDSCCWRLEMMYEEDSDKNFVETDRSILFQLTFKGLGSAGNDISSMLEDGILGYQAPD